MAAANLKKKKKGRTKKNVMQYLKDKEKEKSKKISNVFHETNILKGAKFTHINLPLLLGLDQLPNGAPLENLYIYIK